MADYFNRQRPWTAIGEMSYGLGSGIAEALSGLDLKRAQSREAGARTALYGAQTGFYRTKAAVTEAQQIDEQESTSMFARAAEDLITAGQAQDQVRATEASGRMAQSMARMSR